MDGGQELVGLLERLTPAVARGDREPARDGAGRIVPGHFGRLPSSRWDTPSGEIGNVPRMLDEQAARMARRTSQARLRTMRTEIPLPVELRAVDDAGRIRETVGRWATIVSGRAVPLDAPWDVGVVAGWLAEQIETIRHLDLGHAMLTDLRHVVVRAERGVDRPLARIYLGPCDGRLLDRETGVDLGPCPGEYHGVEGKPMAACSICRAPVEVEQRKAALLAEAGDRWLSAVQIEQLTAALGERVSAQTIDTWRGGRAGRPGGPARPARIRSAELPAAVGGKACWHYPLGDVLRELERMRERRGRTA